MGTQYQILTTPMSKTKEMTPLQQAIALLESERIESPQTDMDRLNNEIIGRLVIRLGALKGVEREFAAHVWNEGAESTGCDGDGCKYYDGNDFDTFYSKYEGE